MTDVLAHLKNLRRISPALATSGQPSESDLALIANEGFEVIINLALHDNPTYSLKDEPGTVASLGMEYVHIPVQWESPTAQDLASFFHAMAQCEGRRVWVHCAANMRVTAFMGLYMVNVLGRSHSEAFAPMRSVWTANPRWAAFIEENLAHAG
jgi:protein tyrosine phosphatase (PTP) superfamily phosphohydrolase (DUF442 family)